MNKKLILLILCLPLVFMLCLFSISKTVSINFSIPVLKIEIHGDSVIYLDMDKNEEYPIDYTVYPTNAKNKKVSFSTEKVGDSPLADLEYVEGKIKALSCGKAKVYLTTIDGGFRDSFVVNVSSNKLQDIASQISRTSMYIGETAQITTILLPEDTAYKAVEYIIPEEYLSIVSVDAKGVITGLAEGYAEIIIRSKSFPDIQDKVSINIKKDLINFTKNDIVTWYKDEDIIIKVSNEDCEYSYKVYDSLANELDESIINVSLDLSNKVNGEIYLNYSLVDLSYIDKDIFIELTAEDGNGFVVTKTCNLVIVDQLRAEFNDDEIIELRIGGDICVPFTIFPYDANIILAEDNECLTNDNISISVDSEYKVIDILAESVGVTTINLKIINAENTDEFIIISKTVVVKPNSMDILTPSNVKVQGFENTYAFGKTDVNEQTSYLDLELSFDGNVGENLYENIIWESSSQNVNIDSNGILHLTGTTGKETVSIVAKFQYNNKTILKSEPFVFDCIYDGVNIYSYLDLHKATNAVEPKPIILQTDIKEDFGEGVEDNYYKEIDTTYDNTYYKNTGNESLAKVKVLIEFKKDVYGNGYEINADNVARKKNLANAQVNALFKGPLNFVAMSESGGFISVKAQDNICFAVYENVTITNITLKGCDLEQNPQNEYDLTDLEYTGTTVEVLGDNVNIQYSRICNGRTVLRVFGDIDDKTKVITLNISNCVLSCAREFIIRIGTNCFIDGTLSNPAPYLPNDNIKTFPSQKNYDKMTSQEKEAYDQAFIKTFVNIKDSALKEAGIFAIGLDSHFSGELLAGQSSKWQELLVGWYDLAKTSYGAKITFQDDVRLYNWTKLNNIDSSTLISVPQNSSFADILSFDINEMITKLSTQDKYKTIIKEDSGVKYVHNGIAFFGGGKNYSVFESNTEQNFNEYEISFDDVEKSMLKSAAGNEKFYFLLNDSMSYEKQKELLDSEEEAYNFIYKK